MWDEDSPVAVNTSAGNTFGNSTGNGFYVGRGRGFGSMSQFGNSLPQVGHRADENIGWKEDTSVSQKSNQSGWDDEWDENNSSSVNNNTWQSNNNGYNSSDFSGSQSNKTFKYSSDLKPDHSYRNKSAKGSNCFKCQEEGHKSHDCPNNDRGRGGSGRNCFNCGDSNHMSRDCPNKENRGGGGGGGRNCFKCNEPGHMSKDCRNKDSGRGRDLSCYKCSGQGHMAKDCTNESQSGGRSKGCFNCGEDGHLSRDCPNERSSKSSRGGSGCYNCGEDGHMSRDCPNEKSAKNSKGGSGCYNCGEDGHMSRDCPNEKSTKNSRGGGCFKCHQDGHMAKDCPNEAVDGNGKPRPPPYIPPEPSEDEESLFLGVPTGINFSKYDDIHVDVTGYNEPPPIDSFESSGLCNLLLKNISNSKYCKPTPVQKYSIPIVMQKRDLMACAQTGSGKTAAFLLPILNAMISSSDLPNNSNNDVQEPWAVVIAPTRELAIQIRNEARKFAYDSVVKVEVVYGGTSSSHQLSRISRGVHLLVATPGRLLDFLSKGKVSFSQLRYLVLDEADRMLDMGFAPAIKEMIDHDSMPQKGVRQTLMFSATFPEDIQRMAKDFLDNYLFLTVGLVGAANSDVTQAFFNVGQFDKRQKLLEILKESGSDRTLVFVEQKRTADFIASLCSQNNIPTTSIHGDRLQQEREEALRDFRSGKMPVLVATAVAARGLDIKDVRHVINYDLPKSIDEYVHRIGRTGRVGNLGKATSFYDSSSDQELARSLKKILKDAQQPIPEWLSEEANQTCGSSAYSGRGNFGSRDVRNQGRSRKIDSNDAFDNNFSNHSAPVSSFNEPVADDEDWG